MQDHEIALVINPGSTSTKIAIYNRSGKVFDTNIRHHASELAERPKVADQLELRFRVVSEAFRNEMTPEMKVVAVVGRGGLMHPVAAGVYNISDDLLDDLRNSRYGAHASNLGAIIANELGKEYGVPSFIVDPVTTDDFPEVARISGHPKIERLSRFHALNMRAVARKLAEKLGIPMAKTRFVGCHMGGGISVCPMEGGRALDANNGLLGQGPFSPDRAGALPLQGVINMCFSGDYDERGIIEEFARKSGLTAYVGSNDLQEVETMIVNRDRKARLVYDAMVYQIAKEMGAAAAVLKGNVDAVFFTGGMAHSKMLTEALIDYVSFIAPVHVFPGSGEMEALAQGAFRVIDGEDEPQEYMKM